MDRGESQRRRLCVHLPSAQVFCCHSVTLVTLCTRRVYGNSELFSHLLKGICMTLFSREFATRKQSAV